MDLRSSYPFWLLDQGIIRSYPSLPHDLHTDVAIMGAGISGALAAWHLCRAGMKVVVLDKRHVGMGSTAASTALLQYEIDTPLRELIGKVGERNAERSYLLCLQAIDELAQICRKFPEAGFIRRPSLQYASFKKDVKDLEKEFWARKKIGISMQWLDKAGLKDKFGFNKEAAILSRDAAEVKAYSLTHALLHNCKGSGLRVYDHTEVCAIHEHRKGVELLTSDGKKIKARKLVIACGYESGAYIPHTVEYIHSTYAIVSEPFETGHFWHRNALIWETASPYLYLRTTPDNRILIGGKDDDFSDGRLRDLALPGKARTLQAAFKKLFPGLDFKVDFKWAGAFASTKDGLPYIGTLPGRPHTYFALGFGGNGITFSLMAARIITNLIKGVKDPDAAIFHFQR
jgi:glycine/D-amino acid oxidase-like deaminating enzyme